MVENTPDDPRQRKPDISKAKEVLSWEPMVKLREGLPLMEENFRLKSKLYCNESSTKKKMAQPCKL